MGTKNQSKTFVRSFGTYVFSALFLQIGCSQSSFSGAAEKSKKATPTPSPVKFDSNARGEPLSRTAKVLPGAEALPISFTGDTPLDAEASKSEAWIVTRNKATRIKIGEDPKLAASWPRDEWSFNLNSRGNRTYVSKIGLLVGRTNHDGESKKSGVWLAPSDAPGTAKQIFKVEDMGPGSRLSVTSFRSGDKEYIGFGYGSASGRKKFVRVPFDASKPNGIDLARSQSVEFGSLTTAALGFSAVGNLAAYGSYMDQSRKSFFLGHQSGAWGVNVQTLKELSSDAIPNKNVAGIKMCDLTLGTTDNLSYALSGDLYGNILAANGAYTLAHDRVNGVVYGVEQGGRVITVAKESCVKAGSAGCSASRGECRAINVPAAVGSIGPMSPLGDGRVVGIHRGADDNPRNPSRVYLLSLVDPKDFSKGLNFDKIADVADDAYMYNDFTGYTMYAPLQVKVIDFKKLKGFDPKKKVKKIAAGWSATSKKVEDLVGMKIEVACYKEGGAKPEYVDYSAQLKTSDTLFTVAAADCSGDIDTLEVRISSDDSTNLFTRLATFEIRGAQ